MDKIIVFEEIYNYTRLLIEWYQFNGYKVYYFRLNSSCKDKRWAKKYIEKEKPIKINDKYDMLSTFIGMYPDPTHDNIEKIAKFALSEDPLIMMITKLYGDGAICDVFKKDIGSKLERFYYLNYIFHNLNKIFPNREIYFVPTLHKEGYRVNIIGVDDYFNFLNVIQKSRTLFYDYKNITFPLWFKLVSRLYGLGSFLAVNFKICGFIGLTVVKFLAKTINKNRRGKKNYKFGIMIISPESQFATESQKVDFLIDEEKIKKNDVLFISLKKLSLQNRNYLTQNKLAFSDGILTAFSLNTAKNTILPALTLMLKAIAYRQKIYVLECALLTLIYYSIWASFKEKYHINNLISCCDFGKQSIARNLLLSKDNTRTWWYLHTNNFISYYIPDTNKANYPQCSPFSLLGYLNYDYVLTWSEEISGYFKKHHQNIKNYTNIGCLWAEHTIGIISGKTKMDFKEKLYKAGFKSRYKLIAVFDSTYLDNSITTYEDGINFIKGISQLLEDISDIFIIFKEKKARRYVGRYSKEMLNLFNKLEEHPRCYLPSNKISSSEAIAFSDLTISFPFTSTTFEALSARKKALYYDASNKFRNTYYDKIPGLVCHNYDELHGRVKELLFAVSKDEYDAYLENNIKNKVETYLDGKAISRFRRLLTAGF